MWSPTFLHVFIHSFIHYSFKKFYGEPGSESDLIYNHRASDPTKTLINKKFFKYLKKPQEGLGPRKVSPEVRTFELRLRKFR